MSCRIYKDAALRSSCAGYDEMTDKDYGDGIGLNLEPDKACANCRHFIKARTNKGVDVYKCEGEANDHVRADASDDTGLESWFEPPATFCCNGWGKLK